MITKIDVMDRIPSVGVGVYAKDVFQELDLMGLNNQHERDRGFVRKVIREGIDSGTILTDSNFRLTKNEKTNAL